VIQVILSFKTPERLAIYLLYTLLIAVANGEYFLYKFVSIFCPNKTELC